MARMWRNGNPSALLVGMQTGATTVETVWSFLKISKMGLPCDPAIPLLGIYLKKPEAVIQKNIYTLIFIAALFTIVKIWKEPKCPSVDEWIKKLWCIYTIECYLDVRQKEILLFTTA